MKKELKKAKYSLYVVDDEDFDNLHKDLPYMTKEKLKDSLGFANPETMEAYVRKTGVKEFDDATLEHEFEELIAKTSPHEEDGIRYKKGGVMKDIAPLLVGALAAPFTGGTSLIPAILGAATSVGMNQYAQSNHPEQLGQPGQIGSILTQGITGALSGMGGTNVAGGIAGGIQGATKAGMKAATSGILGRAAGALSGARSGLMQGASMFAPAKTGVVTGANSLANTFKASQASDQLLGSPVSLGGMSSNITGGMGGLTAAPLMAGAAGGAMSNLLGAIPKTNTPSISSGTSLSDKLTTQPFSLGSNVTPAISSANTGLNAGVNPTLNVAPKSTFMEGLGKLATPQNLLGAGSLGASMLAPTPEFKMPAYVSDLQSKLMAGQSLSPLGQQAKDELAKILSSTPTQLSPTGSDAYYDSILRRTEDAYSQAQKQMDAQYNLAGTYGSGEHMAQKAKLQEEFARTKADVAAQVEQQRFEYGTNQKYQAIQQALGVDAAVMQDIVGLTALDAETVAREYGASVEDIKQIRSSLGTLGIELILRGTTGSGLQNNNSTNETGIINKINAFLGR